MSTIVFAGDSITDAWRRTDPLALGCGYVAIVADRLRELPDAPTVVNSGISGDRVGDLAQRWQTDVLDHHPTVLSIAVGVNDTVVAFTRGRPTPVETFEAQYTEILDSAVSAGVEKLVVVEPFFIESNETWAPWRDGQEFVHEDLAPKRAAVAKLADRYGAAFVPLQALFGAAAAERGAAVVAPDGVHPSPFGTALMVDAWLAAYLTL